MRYFNFYAKDFEGVNGTDFHVEIFELEDGTVEASESHCGRSRGCFWTEPEVVFEGSHFWLTVQKFIRNWGGWSEISDQRIFYYKEQDMTTRREITPLAIKRIRGVMCLTQREFAALLGVSHDYLKAVECGQVNLSLNMLLRLKYHVNTWAFDECVRELNVIVDELRNHVGVN